MPPELSAGTPTRIGRYEVIAHLATGGMAQIYLARQSGLGSFERHVVLKTILRERATDHRFVTMFLDEAKLAATLNHQNIAQVYEVDQADGAYFMAMEYVHGENARAILESSLKKGWTVPLELAVMIVSGAAAGLHHAHERKGKGGQPLNIVHRDVSPANIMVGFDGSVKVLDFGIAKAEERATKTVGGTIKGKYGYMSPEQCKGKTIDRRSDIFALGIVLYELTTLRRAFRGNDDFETMKRIVSGDIIHPSTAIEGYPRELEAIVLTAMATDPNARFQTGAEMIEALDAFTQRAKLTGTGTAMGRFMVQLFGDKREPWVEGGSVEVVDESSRGGGGDATQITEGGPPGEDSDRTQIVEGSQQAALETFAPTPSPPSAPSPPSRPSAPSPPSAIDAWRTSGDVPRAATPPPVAVRDVRPSGGFDPMTGVPLSGGGGGRAQTQPGYPAHANGDASGSAWPTPSREPAAARSQPLPPQLSLASATPSRPMPAMSAMSAPPVPAPWEAQVTPPLDGKIGSNKTWLVLAIGVVIAIAIVIAIATSM